VAGNLTTSAAVNVTVGNGGGGTVVHVKSLTGTASAGTSKWKATAKVSVADQGNAPIGGATVTFSVTGGVTTTVSCITAANGGCSSPKVPVPNAQASVTFTVTDITVPGYTWNGAPAAVTVFRPT
jgi:hypothetical protein